MSPIDNTVLLVLYSTVQYGCLAIIASFFPSPPLALDLSLLGESAEPSRKSVTAAILLSRPCHDGSAQRYKYESFLFHARPSSSSLSLVRFKLFRPGSTTYTTLLQETQPYKLHLLSLSLTHSHTLSHTMQLLSVVALLAIQSFTLVTADDGYTNAKVIKVSTTCAQDCVTSFGTGNIPCISNADSRCHCYDPTNGEVRQLHTQFHPQHAPSPYPTQTRRLEVFGSIR